MATNSGASLRVRVSADLADLKQGMALLRGELAKVQKASAQAAPDESRWVSGLKTIRNQLAGVVSAYAALRAVRTYTELADQAANLSARLRLATKDQAAFDAAYRGTFEIAQRTASEWDSVAGLYARLSQSTNLGQQRILALTETIGQAFQVSGAGAQDAGRGITQLTQAIAGGVLRAEEFNSLIETAPRLVQALADYFGVSFGKVRQLVNDGKVSTEDLVAALEQGGASIQKEFNQLPSTVSRATQQVKTALLALVAGADDGSRASRELALGISGLATTLQSPAVRAGFESFIGGLVATANGAATLVGKLQEVQAAMQEWLNVQVGGQRQLGGEFLAEQRRELAAITAEMEKQAAGKMRGFSVLGLLSESELRNRRAEVERIIELNERLFGDPAKRPPPSAGAAAGVPTPVPRTPSSSGGGAAAKQLAESNALLRDQVSRALAELDRLYAGHEVGLKDYFSERQRLQEQAIDLEIQQARNEMAVTKDAGQRRNLEEQIVKLQRDRAALGATTARDQAAAEADLAKQLAAVNSELLQLNGDSAQAELARLEQEYAEMFKRLAAESNEAGIQMLRKLIDERVIKAQLEDYKRKLSEVVNSLQGTETSVSAQVDAGTLGQVEGERRIQAAREGSLRQLIELRKAVAAFYAATKDESVLQFLQSLDGNIADVTMSMQEFRMKMEDQAESSFGQFISDLVEGTKTFKEAFQDMVRSFVAGVAQMIAQELALRAIRAALSAFGGGGGSAGAAHGGGVAGRLQMTRHNINPMVFGAAPRYHGGGVAGLASNEIPAILQRGETIRTKQQEAALTAQLDASRSTSGGGRVTTPVVAIGDSAVADAMAGLAGENIVVTHVMNNWNRISQGSER